MSFQHESLILRWFILRNNMMSQEHKFWSKTGLGLNPYLTIHQQVNMPPSFIHK